MRLHRPALVLAATALLATAAAPAAAAPQASGAVERVRVVVALDAPAAEVAPLARAQARAAGGRVLHTYTDVLQGYALELPAGAVRALERTPRVTRVEREVPLQAAAVQPTPPVGLDRIDQRTLPLSSSYSSTRTGAGVKAYVVDTGIRLTHVDFQGRARTGIDVVTPGGSADDCNGHGTHVAGTVGGQLAGVAKQVSLVAVRVLDCLGSGTSSGLLAGLDFLVRDHQEGEPAVAVLSLGGPASFTVDRAVRQVVADGITTAVAAGNDAVDACGVSPARVAESLSVGATDSRNEGGDLRASFSNFGPCVQIFAPGVRILSATSTGDQDMVRASGTSMAAPHVAGAAALHLQDEPAASPARVKELILQTATVGVVGNSLSPSSDLLFVESREAAPSPAPSSEPTAAPSPEPSPVAPSPEPSPVAPSPEPSPASPSPEQSAAPAPAASAEPSPPPASPAPEASPTGPAAPSSPSPSPDGVSPSPTSPAPSAAPDDPPLTFTPSDAFGRFTPVAPARVLDTRTGQGGRTGRLSPGIPLTIQLSGRAGIPPAGVTSVALNVTAVAADGTGHLSVYPGGQEPPSSSNLNYRTGQTVPNAVISGLSADGRLSLLAVGGAPHVIVDVVGYYADEQGGSRSVALDPARLLDTRTSLGGLPGRLPDGRPVELQVTGRGGVPAEGVTAVVVNVTAASPLGAGHVTAFPAGTQVPQASTLNYVRGQAVPNLAVVQVGRDGRVAFQASSGQPHLVVDVVAWYGQSVPVRSSSRFVPLPPERVLDTRSGLGDVRGPLPSGRPVRLNLGGRGGVPGVGVTAVVLNVTVVAPSGPGHLTVFPPERELPLASNLNYVRGQTVSNLVFAKVGVDAEVALDLQASSGDPYVLADVVGYTVG